MIQIINKQDCCGCSACKTVCPKQCISMKYDEEGFLYPNIDISICINCGLCEKTCPIINVQTRSTTNSTYTIISKNNKNLKESASGGSFTPLAEYVLNKGGVVFGAAFNHNMQVEHQLAEIKEELTRFCGSKYVQSNIGDSYKRVRLYLKNNRIVLFSGTPCQIQGLYRALGNTKTDNLITFDFVCHGVPSPKVFKKYIEYINSKYNSCVIDYKFRTKKYGYNSNSYSCCYLANKQKIWADKKNKYIQFMTKSFFAEMTSRPSCNKCAFKSKNHISDFTAFDCWHWKQLSKNLNGTMGATTLVVNSEKGNAIFNEIKAQYNYEPSILDKAIKLDGISMLNSIPPNPKRNDFFSSLDKLSIPELYEKFLEPNNIEKLKNHIKSILDKYNILPIIRNLKYKLKQ